MLDASINIAVDAMGGDNAPSEVVRGAIQACKESRIHITLVGNEGIVSRALPGDYPAERITLVHCPDAVGMDDPPLKAFLNKKRSSMRVCFELARKGMVDGVVSAGNSGAFLAAGVLCLGLLEGIDRPAIAGVLPGKEGHVILIDAGANVDCRPSHLFQFGVLAHIFSRQCLSIEKPRIGLLNIGEEGSKGNELVQAAKVLFERSPLEFVGNIEGHDLLSGKADIVVCDGFVGNVALKLIEGVADTIIEFFEREIKDSSMEDTGALIWDNLIGSFHHKFGYERHGGALLLGIKGVSVVCHGDSSSRAIRNAVLLAARYVKNRCLDRMSEEIHDILG